MIIISDTIYVGTTDSGVRAIGYSPSNNASNLSNISIDSNARWSTANYLTSNSISQFELLGDHLLIATIGGGVNRYNANASSWLATWSTNNWLASNVIRGLSLTNDWLHILAGNTIHSYDTTAMLFRSQRQASDMGLLKPSKSILAWPTEGHRGPDSGTVLVSDGSGTLARQVGESLDGTMVVVSSPFSSTMDIATHIDDGEQGDDGPPDVVEATDASDEGEGA
jgi:hypothetical protein